MVQAYHELVQCSIGRFLNNKLYDQAKRVAMDWIRDFDDGGLLESEF